jgi:TolB protein
MAELVYHCPTDLSHPAWSPDGRWIAVAVVEYSTPTENRHLWVVDSRDVSYGLSQLTVGDVEDDDPAWSPDGQTIYFESDRSGKSEIWKIDFQTPSAVERTTWGRIKSRFR